MSKLNEGDRYSKQDRGSVDAYEAYFAGMNSSVQQKVALTTAHFPLEGRVADMGSGSGKGTYDLACLYQHLELVGVDINPLSVGISAKQYQRDNLSFVVGDIAEMVFPENSLDGILDSSVLHHVTSFNDFDVNRVFTTLRNQVDQLKTGGVLIIRDFVIPRGPERVLLDLPSNDGSQSGDIPQLSTSALFEVFARDWRSSVNRDTGVVYRKCRSEVPNYDRYEISLRAAAEFVLRKDYRKDWATELLEEYTYLDQTGFEHAFQKLNLRILVSRPLWNPWIVQNRFAGHFRLQTLGGSPLHFPPTNYLIVGEKVPSGSAVVLTERSVSEPTKPEFLKLTRFKHSQNGGTYEMVERPNLTLDLVPWFKEGEQLFVRAKKGFPRPVLNATTTTGRLNDAIFSGFITEPVSAIVSAEENPTGAANRILSTRAGIRESEVVSVGSERFYFTSPGGVNECVRSHLVEIRPANHRNDRLSNYSHFSDPGSVRDLDAVQVLRASHVGGMYDARLELNIYRLLRNLGASPGPWIGSPIEFESQTCEEEFEDDNALKPGGHAGFTQTEDEFRPRFLSLRRGEFAELDGQGKTLGQAVLEYVVPRKFGINSITALPVVRTSTSLFVGVEHRDLPAVQTFTGSSSIVTVPAWRVPPEIINISEANHFVRIRFMSDFEADIRRAWELGGSYFSTPGITPEIVHPFVVELDSACLNTCGLRFVRIERAMDHLDKLVDAHLIISICRLAHALNRIH